MKQELNKEGILLSHEQVMALQKFISNIGYISYEDDELIIVVRLIMNYKEPFNDQRTTNDNM